MEDFEVYLPEKVFRMFSLFKQIMGHVRVTTLPLPITFAFDIIKEMKVLYQVMADSIYSLFNSGKGSMKAIGGAITFGPLVLLSLMAMVGNQGIELARHLSMITMIAFTFACFNVFLSTSKYMLFVQIATIGFFFMLYALRNKKKCRLILDLIFSGVALIFMIYFDSRDTAGVFEAVSVMVVGGLGMALIAFYIFFGLFTCCYKRCCCYKFKFPQRKEAISILKSKENQLIEITDVADLRTQQTHFFFWVIIYFGVIAFEGMAIILLILHFVEKDPNTVENFIFVIVFFPCGLFLFLTTYLPRKSDQWCTDDPSMKRARRRGMIARYSLKLIYLILDFMAVPLTKCIVETLYDSTIQKAALGQYVLLSFFAQIIGFPAIYIVTMVETHNILKTVYNPSTDMSEEMKWMKYCEHIDSSTVANFEIYKYKFRYWFFVKYAVDLVDGVLSVAYKHNPKVFYGSFALHILFLAANCIFRPSFYWVHNIVAITSGISSFLEDINIILDINQKENWTEKTPFIIALLIIPIVAAIISIVSFLIEKCVRKNMTKLDLEEKNHYRCIGFILEDRAFDLFSWWSLHMIAIGIGILMVSMAVSIDMPNDKIWMGFGIFETILFCAGWIFSLKITALNITEIPETTLSDVDNSSEGEKESRPGYHPSYNV